MVFSRDELLARYKELVQQLFPQSKRGTYSFWNITGLPMLFIAAKVYQAAIFAQRQNRETEADGNNLDQIGLRHGVIRKPATSGEAFLLFDGPTGTIIDAGVTAQTVPQVDDPGRIFSVVDGGVQLDITLATISFAVGVGFEINDSSNSFTFVDGETIQVTDSVSNDGQYTVLTATASQLLVFEEVTTEIAGASVRFDRLFEAESIQTGASQNTAANTITDLNTAIIGVTTVNNPVQVINAIDEEEDGPYYRPNKNDDELGDYETNDIELFNFRGRIIDAIVNKVPPLSERGYIKTITAVPGVATATIEVVTTNLPEIHAYVSSIFGNGVPTASLIQDVQDEFLNDTNIDVLEWAMLPLLIVQPISPVVVNIDYDVDVLPAFDLIDVQADLTTRISQFMLRYTQDQEFVVAELDNVIHDTSGVYDYTRNLPAGNLAVLVNEKAVEGTITLTLTTI